MHADRPALRLVINLRRPAALVVSVALLVLAMVVVIPQSADAISAGGGELDVPRWGVDGTVDTTVTTSDYAGGTATGYEEVGPSCTGVDCLHARNQTGVVWFNDAGTYANGPLPTQTHLQGIEKCYGKVADGPYSYNVGAEWTVLVRWNDAAERVIVHDVRWQCYGPPSYKVMTFICPDYLSISLSSDMYPSWRPSVVRDIGADYRDNCKPATVRIYEVHNRFGTYMADSLVRLKIFTVYRYTSPDKRTGLIPDDYVEDVSTVEHTQHVDWQQFCHPHPYWAEGHGGSYAYDLTDCPPSVVRCEAPDSPHFGSRSHPAGRYQTIPDGRWRTVEWGSTANLVGSAVVAQQPTSVRYEVDTGSTPLRQRGAGETDSVWMNSDSQHFDGTLATTTSPFNRTLTGAHRNTHAVQVRFFKGSEPIVTQNGNNSVIPWTMVPTWRIRGTVAVQQPAGFEINSQTGDIAITGLETRNVVSTASCSHEPVELGVLTSRLLPN